MQANEEFFQVHKDFLVIKAVGWELEGQSSKYSSATASGPSLPTSFLPL